MNGAVSLTVTAAGKITSSGNLQAGAVEVLTINGAFHTDHVYRLTLKPTSKWADPLWVVTLTAFTVGSTTLVGSLNLNSASLISYVGSSSRKVAIELWDDTLDAPVGRKTDIYCDSPVQRDDDVPETAQPARSMTDEQILAAIETAVSEITPAEIGAEVASPTDLCPTFVPPSYAINYSAENRVVSVQGTLTGSVTFTKGTGWPTRGSYGWMIVKFTSAAFAGISWSLVDHWITLTSETPGTHFVRLEYIDGEIIASWMGHYE